MLEDFPPQEVIAQALSEGLAALKELPVDKLVSVTRSLTSAALGLDGTRRFIKAGTMRHKASYLIENGQDEGAEKQQLLDRAEKETVKGAVETTAAAGCVGEYAYMVTEASIVLTSMLTMLSKNMQKLNTPIMKKVRTVLPILALIPLLFKRTGQQLLVSIGAVALGSAFSMKIKTKENEQSYQKRSLVGGTIYGIGSAIGCITSPSAIGKAVSAWFTGLNGAFAGSAAKNLEGGNEKMLEISTPPDYKALLDNDQIDWIGIKQHPEAIDDAIATLVGREKLQGKELTDRILAIRFSIKAVCQEVPLQPGEEHDAIPKGQKRIVGLGRIVYVPEDPSSSDYISLVAEGDQSEKQREFMFQAMHSTIRNTRLEIRDIVVDFLIANDPDCKRLMEFSPNNIVFVQQRANQIIDDTDQFGTPFWVDLFEKRTPNVRAKLG